MCNPRAPAPKDVLDEAGTEGDGELVAEVAEVQSAQGRPNARRRLGQYSAEHRHKVALVAHLRQRQQQR